MKPPILFQIEHTLQTLLWFLLTAIWEIKKRNRTNWRGVNLCSSKAGQTDQPEEESHRPRKREHWRCPMRGGRARALQVTTIPSRHPWLRECPPPPHLISSLAPSHWCPVKQYQGGAAHVVNGGSGSAHSSVSSITEQYLHSMLPAKPTFLLYIQRPEQ